MIKVKRLPEDPGPAAWNVLLPPSPQARRLDESITADWLVIGAGWAGLAAARRLRQNRADDDIVLLEATRVGDGPAGRNSGFMIDLPHDLASDGYSGSADSDRKQIAMNRAAIAFATEAASELGMPEEAFVQSGKLMGAATDKGVGRLEDYARHLDNLGETHEILDAEAMSEITGIPYYRKGLYTPGAAMVQPAMFVRAMARGIAAAGVSIFEQSPVTSLSRRGQGWRATTPAGSITAPKVILAVNGHAESFGFFQRRLMHVFTYASMSRQLSAEEVARLGGRPTWGVLPADPMGTTVRRISGTGGDRIVVRNRFTCDPSLAIGDDRLGKISLSHDKSFVARFPMLDGVDMAYRWGGRLCLSRNAVPAFGEIETSLYAACCQNGLGTTKGTLAGMLAADLATGSANPMIEDMLAFDQPERLPPEPFASLGANAVMRWKERKAGAEF